MTFNEQCQEYMPDDRPCINFAEAICTVCGRLVCERHTSTKYKCAYVCTGCEDYQDDWEIVGSHIA